MSSIQHNRLKGKVRLNENKHRLPTLQAAGCQPGRLTSCCSATGLKRETFLTGWVQSRDRSQTVIQRKKFNIKKIKLVGRVYIYTAVKRTLKGTLGLRDKIQGRANLVFKGSDPLSQVRQQR